MNGAVSASYRCLAREAPLFSGDREHFTVDPIPRFGSLAGLLF